MFDEECERELEKELEKEIEKEEQLPSQRAASEVHWDYPQIFRVDSPLSLTTCRPVPLAKVRLQGRPVCWPSTVVCTTNFLSTVVRRLDDFMRLDEFMRVVDVLIAFPSGEVRVCA